MKLSKRSNTIIMWAISIGLLAGMVVMFTPRANETATNPRGIAEMVVNGQTLYELDLRQIRSNSLFNTVTEGEVGQDLQRLMVDEVVRNTVLDQAAARISISGGQVKSAVDDFRAERGVAGARNDQAYRQLIGSSGFTDESFRAYIKDQLRLQEWENRLVKDVTVSDAEVRAYYDSHVSSYQSEEKIVARQLVVDDQALAERLRREALAGADFATLARENSIELADRDGAIGAAAGETTPRPVGRPALPTVVANAAFFLRGAGITDPVLYNQRYYVVQVESYEPAGPVPFDDVKQTVADDALNAKKTGVVEAEIDRLRDAAVVTFPAGSELSYDNPVLAKVGDHEIRAVELDRALYTNTQIQQALSPQTADLIVGLFKPTVLNQLIDMEVAYQGAAALDVPLVGTRSGIAQAALNYVSRDAVADEAEIEKYYSDNEALYTMPAEATVTRVDFTDQRAAADFRDLLLAGRDVAAANEAAAGSVSELGRVKPGDLPAELDTALFNTNAFDALPGGSLSVSDVLVLQEPVEPDTTTESPADDANAAAEVASSEAAEGTTSTEDLAGDGEPAEAPAATRDTYVVLVADRVPARVRSLADVRAQVEQAVLSQKRQAQRNSWLAEERAQVTVVETAQPDQLLPTDFLPQEPTAGAAEGAATDTQAEPGTPEAQQEPTTGN